MSSSSVGRNLKPTGSCSSPPLLFNIHFFSMIEYIYVTNNNIKAPYSLVLGFWTCFHFCNYLLWSDQNLIYYFCHLIYGPKYSCFTHFVVGVCVIYVGSWSMHMEKEKERERESEGERERERV